MYVRVPIDLDESKWGYRDYYLGCVESFNEIEDTFSVTMQDFDLGKVIYRKQDYPSELLVRCQILPNTKFIHADEKSGGLVLNVCEETWVEGTYREYFVQMHDRTQILSEADMIIPSHRGDPDPIAQLINYEFHHPSFRPNRDDLVQSYTDLQDATFGIEDLLSSRVMLLAHQAEVVSRVLEDQNCRYILADEVGLGKTIEACVILKGLRRRNPSLRTLIITPASLMTQWFYELDQKFWMRFATTKLLDDFLKHKNIPGIIISTEELESNSQLAFVLKMQEWDLLIVDEAHNIHKKDILFEHLVDLSEYASSALILSATPIQRRANEFLSLLKLMDPSRYQGVSAEDFSQIQKSQFQLMQIIASIVPDLKEEYFDPDDFLTVLRQLNPIVELDTYLKDLINEVEENVSNPKKCLQFAKNVIAYICENYRLERRLIRNRRANLQITLPEREVDDSEAYDPLEAELNILNELHDYIDSTVQDLGSDPWVLEYTRILLHSAFSSPYALEENLEFRTQKISGKSTIKASLSDLNDLVTPVEPRRESQRIEALIKSLPEIQDEERKLNNLQWHLKRWREDTDNVLETIKAHRNIEKINHRIPRVLRSINNFLTSKPEAKIVVFSSWYPTLVAIKKFLVINHGSRSIAEFHRLIDLDNLQEQADKFQNQETCSIMLCDELGGEGRNFQIADLIIHVDIPWSPSMIEQRIGRVDRLGREGVVTSLVPYSRNTVESDLFMIWQEAFKLFTESLSGMEIALENIQDQIIDSFKDSSRNGLIIMLDDMVVEAKELRLQVDEERYYEEETINERRRDEFNRLNETYSDGETLRIPLLSWANQAGLSCTHKPKFDTVRYFPKSFNLKMMRNAKFAEIPNMEEALERSREKTNLHITGTFNRHIAVMREDLVFFAPGSDPWTDSIIKNAIEADRGRCSAIRRISDEIEDRIGIFDLFFTISLNSRPLLNLKKNPIHLLRGQGYLYIPSFRLFISEDGSVVPGSHPVQKILKKPFSNDYDSHLGKRSGRYAEMEKFILQYPPPIWKEMVESVITKANRYITEEFGFFNELAMEAESNFDHACLGMQATRNWYNHHGFDNDANNSAEELKDYQEISSALVQGINEANIRLESICYWSIEPHHQ